MRILNLVVITGILSCTQSTTTPPAKAAKSVHENLIAQLDTIWNMEQNPIRLRDSIGRILGFESKEFQVQQELCDKNHAINEKKIIQLLERQGWPSEAVIGDQGNLTICNVLQHSSLDIRLKYLPMMRAAVKEKKLAPRLLARAEDRIATDRGELQIYGGQIKYYPETKSFDVWPILDPINVDKRRAEIGLPPMAEFLSSRRTPMEWNVAEQIKRSEAFEKEK